MAWQDRHYYRERGSGMTNPLMWLLTGSIPLFTLFGIRVRAHASLLVLLVLMLLLGWGNGGVVARVQSATVLFGVILLHEFGHCFGARITGGSADEILMTPLGGIAMAMARQRPWPTFVTVVCGPLVNVLLCIICGLGIYLLQNHMLFSPNSLKHYFPRGDWLSVYNYLYWIYAFSLALLIFNLLPIYPLDGGQLLQSILWKPMGYYKSMMLMLNVGLVGSVLLVMYGLATLGSFVGGLLPILIGVGCFITCFQQRAMMKAEGPWGFQEHDAAIDYTASLYDSEKPTRAGFMARRSARRQQRREQDDRDEQRRIDAILEKVSQHGMHSLSWLEKRALKKATEHQRERDLQAGRSRRI